MLTLKELEKEAFEKETLSPMSGKVTTEADSPKKEREDEFASSLEQLKKVSELFIG